MARLFKRKKREEESVKTSTPLQRKRHLENTSLERYPKRSRLPTIPYQSPILVHLDSGALPKIILETPKRKSNLPRRSDSTKRSVKIEKRSIAVTKRNVTTEKRTSVIVKRTSVTENRISKKTKKSVISQKSASGTTKSDKKALKKAPQTTVIKSLQKAAKKPRVRRAKAVTEQQTSLTTEDETHKSAKTDKAPKSKGKKKPAEDTAKPTAAKRKRSKKEADTDGVDETDGKKKRQRKVAVAKPVKLRKRRGAVVLEPKPHVTDYEKDPTFESTLEIPSVSTLADSRLLIRAVLLKNKRLLETLLTNKDNNICSRRISRSMSDNSSAFTYALKQENLDLVKVLIEEPKKENYAPYPEIQLENDSTGHGSRLMFGHALSQVTVGRGGREGNAAFLKDSRIYGGYNRIDYINSGTVKEAMQLGVSYKTLEALATISKDTSFISNCCDNVIHAIRTGNIDLAGKLVAEGNKRGGFGFNFLHEEVLVKKKEPLTKFKAVSVVKKCTNNARVTPLHCACINPNTDYLIELLNERPDLNVLDTDNWSLLHYAAVCSSPAPLEYLLSRGGISSQALNKEGDTPIHLACRLGRLENVRAILKHELISNEDEREDKEEEEKEETEEENAPKSKKKPKNPHEAALASTSLVHVNKKGLNALQTAASSGHQEIVGALLDVPGMDVNKATNAKQEKMSPLLLACQYGHVGLVKFLCEQKDKYAVKLEQPDRRGRTALAYAVINGHAHLVSYLLRFGLNHLTTDSSGNSLLHYAAAYGWYFNAKLLIEAGCPVNVANLWKLTPIAAAFMKGHIGLVQFLLDHPDVDINSPINYRTGMSLLLETCSGTPSKALLDRVKFLVDKQGADAKLTDYSKNTVMHLLVLTEQRKQEQHRYYSTPYESSQEHRYLIDIAKFVIDRGCDPMARNDQGESAVSMGIKVGCFAFLCKLMDNFQFELETSTDEEKSTMLHSLVRHATKPGTETFYRKVAKKGPNMDRLREMATMRNTAGQTPLLKLLATFANSGHDIKELKRIKDLMMFLLEDLNSDVNAVIEDEEDKRSALHLAVDATSADQYLEILLKFKPNLEVTNKSKNSPLVMAVLAAKSGAINVLLEAGADVNVSLHRPGKPPRSILLEVADAGIGGSFLLIPTLVQNGANVLMLDEEGNSPLHLVSKTPGLQGAFEAIQELLKMGSKADKPNKKGRTPLHLCINGRGGETDVTYEIEDALIEAAPATLSMWDIRGRLPLHYAFVKIRNFRNSSFIDPIEIVALLVKAMRDNGQAQEITFADAFQCTPLHYAAARGATICTSFMADPKLQDAPDKDGNTPFGLSVLNGHQACALNFQQKKANFTVKINKHREDEGLAEKDDAWTTISSQERHEEEKKQDKSSKIATILEEVANREWQGIMYLFIESLREGGSGVGPAIQAAIKTHRLKLAQKILLRVKNAKEMTIDEKEGSVLISLAKNCGTGQDGQLEILSMMLDKGIDIHGKDELNASAIIYAAMSRNGSLCRVLSERIMAKERTGNSLSKVVGRDFYGRSVFSAIFHNLHGTEISEEMERWVRSVISPGDWNVRSHFPIKLSPFPGIRYLSLADLHGTELSDDNHFPPLIAAVIYGNYSVAKWLLNHPTCPVDVNFPDAKGRTAIMHAVRLNDMKMVKLLLKSRYYTPTDDQVPWKETTFSISGCKIDFTAADKDGRTLFHYMLSPTELPYSYTNSKHILKLLFKSNAPGVRAYVQGDKSVAAKAASLNRYHLYQAFQKLQLSTSKQSNILTEFPEFPKIDQPSLSFLVNNVRKDALDNVAKLRDLAGEDPNSGKIKPDPLIGREAEDYEVVVQNDQPFDCVMTKVDLNYGMYGLYNFYKMQLIQQPKGSGMILLFTRWGRVGDDGQYQKTPFGSLEEAIKEFCKIFKSKSGNAWEDLNTFNPMPNRYRLVNKNLRSGKLPREVKVNFDELEKVSKDKSSELQKPTFELVRGISLIHKSQGSLRSYGRHIHDLPFGLLTLETLEKGEEILGRIEKLINEKTNLPSSHSRDQEQIIMEAIVEASQEFYAAVPVYGFASERLSPMFNLDDVRSKQEMIYNIIHLEFASQLLHAGHWNVSSRNPIDYIYSCLNTKIELMNKDAFESQMILHYIQNTSDDYSTPKVFNIFRVERQGEAEAIKNCGVGNRWLLWHGTRSANLLSILSNGLQVAPMGAELNGHLFGKGIYFADMFAKSSKYTCGGDTQYLLLCEVALGKTHHIKLNEMTDKMTTLPTGCQSLKTLDSRYQPDPGTSIHWQNRVVPLGKRTTQILDKRNYYGLDYNEFIVFNNQQVSIKYLVQFG